MPRIGFGKSAHTVPTSAALPEAPDALNNEAFRKARERLETAILDEDRRELRQKTHRILKKLRVRTSKALHPKPKDKKKAFFGIVALHPGWSMTKKAREAGIHRVTAYKWIKERLSELGASGDPADGTVIRGGIDRKSGSAYEAGSLKGRRVLPGIKRDSD